MRDNRAVSRQESPKQTRSWIGLAAFALLVLGLVVSSTAAGAGVQYLHEDALGSVRAVTDENGNVISRHDYLPFGEEIPAGSYGRDAELGYGGGASLRLRFTGKERDGESALDYFGARYFSGAQGRFTSPDPVIDALSARVDPQRWNRYAYARDSPLKYIDRDGQLTVIVHGTFARGSGWMDRGSSFNQSVSAYFRERAMAFPWTGGNNKGARREAALGLKNFIDAVRKPGEPLRIIAHSHGGNVVKDYTQLEGAQRIDVLVTLGTPQRSDYVMDAADVALYVNVYSDEDDIQGKGGRWFMPLAAGARDPLASINIDAQKALSGMGDHRRKIEHSNLHDDWVWWWFVVPELQRRREPIANVTTQEIYRLKGQTPIP